VNAVLVGGIGDGRRVVVRDDQTRYELVPLQRVNLSFDRVPEPLVYTVHRYNLFRLHPVTRAVIFAHEDLTPTQIMERLLEGYSPETDGERAYAAQYAAYLNSPLDPRD